MDGAGGNGVREEFGHERICQRAGVDWKTEILCENGNSRSGTAITMESFQHLTTFRSSLKT